MDNFLYDLVGTDPDFLVENRLFRIFTSQQRVNFDTPVYASTIVVKLANDTTLTQGVDYIYSSQTDIAAMSEAKLQDNTFADTLVSGITMVETSVAEDYTISVSYQTLKRPRVSDNLSTEGPPYNPGVMEAALARLDQLSNMFDPNTNYDSNILSGLQPLAVDLTGAEEANLIEEEEHRLNGDLRTIQLNHGAFYKHDLVVVHGETELTYGDDYVVFDCDQAKTGASTPTSGVYNSIVFKSAFTETLKITYRAYGGQVTIQDLSSIREALVSMQSLITNNAFLTANNIDDTDLANSIRSEISRINTHLRHYAVVQLGVTAAADEHKWVTIAHVEDNPWTDIAGVLASDSGTLRVQVPTRCFEAEVNLAYSTETGTLEANVINIMDPKMDDTTHYLDNRIGLAFRVCWRSDDLENGVLLQMAMIGAAGDVDVRIRDITGTYSPWNLYNYLGELAPNDKDDAAGYTTVFNTEIGFSQVNNVFSTTAYANVGTYTIFQGMLAMDAAMSYIQLDADYNALQLPFSDVVSVAIDIYDRQEGKFIYAQSGQVYSVYESMTATCMYYMQDLCSVSIALTREGKINFVHSAGTRSALDARFDIVAVHLVTVRGGNGGTSGLTRTTPSIMPSSHNHDSVYSPIGHNHNGLYSFANHLHDDRYALLSSVNAGVLQADMTVTLTTAMSMAERQAAIDTIPRYLNGFTATVVFENGTHVFGDDRLLFEHFVGGTLNVVGDVTQDDPTLQPAIIDITSTGQSFGLSFEFCACEVHLGHLNLQMNGTTLTQYQKALFIHKCLPVAVVKCNFLATTALDSGYDRHAIECEYSNVFISECVVDGVYYGMASTYGSHTIVYNCISGTTDPAFRYYCATGGQVVETANSTLFIGYTSDEMYSAQPGSSVNGDGNTRTYSSGTTNTVFNLPQLAAYVKGKTITVMYTVATDNECYINPDGTDKIMELNQPLQASNAGETIRTLTLKADVDNSTWVIVGGINTWEHVAAVPVTATNDIDIVT